MDGGRRGRRAGRIVLILLRRRDYLSLAAVGRRQRLTSLSLSLSLSLSVMLLMLLMMRPRDADVGHLLPRTPTLTPRKLAQRASERSLQNILRFIRSLS